MLAAHNAYCHPDSIANAFSSLLSIFNKLRGKNEPILAFCSRFDGLILEMARCNVVIPPLLLVILFLRALHSRYSDIVEQFWTWHNSLDTKSIEMIVADVTYHDKFILKEPCRQDKSSKTLSRIPAAYAAHTDNAGTVWSSPFDWLSKGYGEKGIRTRWKKALGGSGICPICHQETPKHVPKDCTLLKSLNLKLIHVAPMASPPAPTPAASAPAVATPSPGGRMATVDLPSSGGSIGNATAPSGLTAHGLDVMEDFDSDDNFCWDGDESGADYIVHSHKSNNSTALYPLCCSFAVHPLPRVNPFDLPKATPNSMTKLSSSPTDVPTTNGISTLSRRLRQLIQWVSHASIGGFLSKRFAVADTGATNHMLPEKAIFISYKLVSNLQVRMSNYSFLHVLGHGTAVISLDSQRVLIRNALHVPGLVMPLYSLRGHLTQCGCAFYGAYAAGMLICFPTFVLAVDTSSDCHLSNEPLGCCTPLDILHYVQPWCPPTLYPSELASFAPLLCKASHVPGPALIEDELGDSLSGDLDQLLVSPPFHLPVCGVLPTPQPTNADTLDLSTISLQLTSLAKAISNLSPLPPLPLHADAPT
jgi:hypothetical protein